MEFIIDYLLPVLGGTVIGMMIIILLVLLVLTITILIHIKDYKAIKSNLKLLKRDIKSNFCGKGNKKNRAKIMGVLGFCLVTIFLISGIYI